MKLIHESISCLFHLLLLTELFACSASFPTHGSSLCGIFGSMIHHLERLLNSSKRIHDLTNEELIKFDAVEDKLESLPDIHHTADHFRTLKVNESLLQLHVDAESFRLHVDWLRAAKENVSLPFRAEEDANSQLLQLSGLIKKSLHLIKEELPQSPAPSLPVVSNSFEALTFSVEISERLQVFCIWSKRILRHLHRQTRCPRH